MSPKIKGKALGTHIKGHDLDSNLQNGNQIAHEHQPARLFSFHGTQSLEVNFAATCFSVSINKCIRHSQGLSKFIKAAGSAPGETDNPSFPLTDSQGEPMSIHRLLSLSNLISSPSYSSVLDSCCVKWKH